MITLDTNILLRLVLNDVPEHTERVKNLLKRAQSGQVTLYVPATVFGEMSYVLVRLRGITRRHAADAMLGILQIAGIEFEHSDAIEMALIFWRTAGGLSFVDCYHLTRTIELGMDQIYSFDQKMDRLPGVERLEP